VITQPAKYETCECCGSRKRIEEEQVACDQCHKVLSEEGSRFDITVHLHEGAAEHYYFDSVACSVKWLNKWKAPRDFYFISLPLLKTPLQVKYFVQTLPVKKRGGKK
jgi:hypothetical protein